MSSLSTHKVNKVSSHIATSDTHYNSLLLLTNLYRGTDLGTLLLVDRMYGVTLFYSLLLMHWTGYYAWESWNEKNGWLFSQLRTRVDLKLAPWRTTFGFDDWTNQSSWSDKHHRGRYEGLGTEAVVHDKLCNSRSRQGEQHRSRAWNCSIFSWQAFWQATYSDQSLLLVSWADCGTMDK